MVLELDRKKVSALVAERYTKAVQENFAEYYSYAFQTGSFVYGGGTAGKSDLDVCIVFRNDSYLIPAGKLMQKIVSFVDEYLNLHLETGFNPDCIFPGEYITEDQMADSIKGRGFHVNKGGLFLPNASTEYWLADSERFYRAWLGQAAFSRFLVGDYEAYLRNKVSAWQTIILFLLNDSNSTQSSLDYIFLGSLRFFSVHNDYPKFRDLEENYVRLAMKDLSAAKFIDINENTIIPNKEQLQCWENRVASALVSRSIRRAKDLLDMQQIFYLAQVASKMWQEKTFIFQGSP